MKAIWIVLAAVVLLAGGVLAARFTLEGGQRLTTGPPPEAAAEPNEPRPAPKPVPRIGTTGWKPPLPALPAEVTGNPDEPRPVPAAELARQERANRARWEATIAHLSPVEAARSLYGRGYKSSLLDEKMNEAVQLNPESFEARIVRGNVYYKMTGDYEAAVEDYRKAVELDPGSGEARQLLAGASYASGRYDDALAEAFEAIRRGRDNALVRLTLGMAYGKKGDDAAALRHFRKAIEYNPRSQSAQYGVERYERRLAEADAAVAPGADRP